MFETKYNKFLTILLIVIIVAIIGLASYLGYTYYSDYKTNEDASKYVETFIEEAEEKKEEEKTEGNISENIEEAESENTSGSKKYKDEDIIGTIQIPKTGINYPVYKDPPTVKKLETAVSALYPQNAELNKEGNVVIVGHNYRNGLFFSNNKKLTNGDKIYITDLNGKKVTYVVYNVFQTNESDTSFYNRDTDGAMEITLSTCTDASNDQRIIVEARAE